MADVKKKLDDILDLPREETSIEVADTEVSVEQVAEINRDKDIDDDYNFVRENLRGLITQQKAALEKMIDLSDETEHPRMFEVMGQIMKSMADTNKDLLEIQKKTKELKNEKLGGSKKDSPKSVNQTIFVGSTKELQEFFKKQKNGELPEHKEDE